MAGEKPYIEAILYGQNNNGTGAENDFRQAFAQPKETDSEKRFEKEQDQGMLPRQSQWSQQNKLEINTAKKDIQREKYDWYYKNPGKTPPKEVYQNWNRKMAMISMADIEAQSYDARFKANFAMANEYQNKLIEGGERSTANSIALQDVNGVLVPVIGDKGGGTPGWMTHIEMVSAFDQLPGKNSSGQAQRVALPTEINYSGDFNKLIDDSFDKAAKSGEVVPIFDDDGKTVLGYQRSAGIIGDEDSKFMSIITTENNVGNVISAAQGMIERLTPSARHDLASDFYKTLLIHPETMEKLTDQNGSKYKLNESEQSTLRKLYDMQGLGREDLGNINNLIEAYGRKRIFDQVPVHTQTIEKIRDVSTATGSGVGSAAAASWFRGIATDQTPPDKLVPGEKGNSAIGTYREGKVINASKATPGLRQWTLKNPDYLRAYNSSAFEQNKNEVGMDPRQFTPTLPYFWTDNGVPNKIMDLVNNNAHVVGLTGQVKEFYAPDEKPGEGGNLEFDIPDIHKSMKDLRKIMAVQVTVAVDDAYLKNFRKSISDLDEKQLDVKQGIDEERFNTVHMGEDGKVKKHMISLWLPLSDKEGLKLLGDKSPAMVAAQQKDEKIRQRIDAEKSKNIYKLAQTQ